MYPSLVWAYFVPPRVCVFGRSELDDELAQMASQRVPYAVSTGRSLGSAPAVLETESSRKLWLDRMPVLRPRLPSAAEILPYLNAVDERRWYSNLGPLVV